MKVKYKIIIFVILVIGIAGVIYAKNTTSLRRDNEVSLAQIDKIQDGMDRSEVIDICGIPYYDKDIDEIREELYQGKKVKVKFEQMFPNEIIDDDYFSNEMIKSIEDIDEVQIMRYFILDNEKQELFLFFKDDKLVVKKLVE